MAYMFDSWVALGDSNMLDYVVNKRKSARTYIRYMLIRLQKMFKYSGLPETIPYSMLEYYLLINGTCFVTKEDGKLYAFIGGAGGEPDAYYRPTVYTVANPALKLSKSFDIGKDGILMRNDSLWVGLMPMMSRFASLLAENLVSIRSADIMLRAVALLSAPDDKTKTGAELYLKKLEKGEFGVIGENRFFDGVRMQSPPSNNGSYLTQFIELQQYLKASFFNEVGLNANYNMKREAINEGESALNEDSLMPLVEDMLRVRREDVAAVNEMFGTKITVDFDSSWLENMLEREYALAVQEQAASQLAKNGGEGDVSDVQLDSASESGESDGYDGDFDQNGDELPADADAGPGDGGDGAADTGDDGTVSGGDGDTDTDSGNVENDEPSGSGESGEPGDTEGGEPEENCEEGVENADEDDNGGEKLEIHLDIEIPASQLVEEEGESDA